jgi:hypothetical protein
MKQEEDMRALTDLTGLMSSGEARFEGVELMNKLPGIDVKQHTVPSMGRDVNYIPWVHETEENEYHYLSIQPLFLIAPATEDIQTRQGRTCNLHYNNKQLIRKLQCRNKYVHIQLPLCCRQNGELRNGPVQ